MVSWSPADGNANDIQDSNNGTLEGGTAFGAGEVGLAFDFNGSNEYVLIPISASLEPQRLTVDAWVYVRSLGDLDPLGSDVIFSKDRTSSDGISYALLASRPGLPPDTRLPCLSTAGCFFGVVALTSGGFGGFVGLGSRFEFNQWYQVAALQCETIKRDRKGDVEPCGDARAVQQRTADTNVQSIADLPEAPDSAIPVGAIVVSVPPHAVATELATVSPVGRMSLKATPARATVVFGFVMVKVRLVVPLSAIVDGLNTLLIVGDATTMMLADAVLPVPPLV